MSTAADRCAGSRPMRLSLAPPQRGWRRIRCVGRSLAPLRFASDRIFGSDWIESAIFRARGEGAHFRTFSGRVLFTSRAGPFGAAKEIESTSIADRALHAREHDVQKRTKGEPCTSECSRAARTPADLDPVHRLGLRLGLAILLASLGLCLRFGWVRCKTVQTYLFCSARELDPIASLQLLFYYFYLLFRCISRCNGRPVTTFSSITLALGLFSCYFFSL